MSEAMSRMREIRRELIAHERESALVSLTKHIHAIIEPRITPQTESVLLFGNYRGQIDHVFHDSAQVRAASWIFDDLRNYGMLTGDAEDAALTRRGIEEFCKEATA